MERLINKAELSQNRVWLTSQLRCEVNHTSINNKMSSFFYNLLDNYITFAKAII